MESSTIQCISISDATETQRWDSFIEMHPSSTPYHFIAWIKTIKDTYGYKPLLYMIKNKAGSIECIFPLFLINSFFTRKRIISLPFSDYGGPVSNSEAFPQLVIDKISNDYPTFCRNIEVRSTLPKNNRFEPFNYYKRHILKLDADEKEIKSRFNKRTIQYSIRKAERVGVKVYEDNSRNGLNHFIRLNKMTRKKHSVPSQPDKFFDSLFKNIISKDCGFLLLAEYDSKIIAASMFIISGRQIHYKYNASDILYLKKASPNHLITWVAIKKGIAEGYDLLDFGRTASDNHGLIRYKQMWGTHEVDCAYSYFPKIQGASSKTENSLFYKLSTKIWKILPEFMRTSIGSYIYKYLC